MHPVAEETLRVVEEGAYTAPSGRRVDLRAEIDRALEGTVLYRDTPVVDPGGPTTRIEVTDETTTDAARRLGGQVAALNFASARNPGGGFLGGAKAQEEDLARCSALYTCLIRQPEYYDANRAQPSPLYTDLVIYSPQVPFFRGDDLRFLETPFFASVLTAPAPNAGAFLQREPDGEARVRATLERRAEKVLRIALDRGHRVLVLGAWGCGVFRNDPSVVADVFARLLERYAFERVVFAVYDPSASQRTLSAFRERFRQVQ